MRTARLLPYPDGKLFAFTIVDDTDGQTLDVTRAVYDELIALGLKTTKTVWVTPPASPPSTRWDEGDTLEDADYLAYHKRLESAGFEIALHNVSSRSNKRNAIAAGIERFRDLFGHYPKMNIHHEKNLENLYFDVANDPSRLPGLFRSRAARAAKALLRRRPGPAAPRSFPCCGEQPAGEHFWGDICRDKIRYVRSNVFIDDLNTIRHCPAMPIHYADTPDVNYWFYSSEGQDAAHFNRMLSAHNVARLRREHGASILYTHFGKGFTTGDRGRQVLNGETRERLRHIAAQPDGWFVPAGELLDRLLVFQKVLAADVSRGFALRNDNSVPVRGVTVLTSPDTRYYTPNGEEVRSDAAGRLVIDELPAAETLLFLPRDVSAAMRTWLEPETPLLWRDSKEAARRIGELLRSKAQLRARGPERLHP